MNGNGILIYGNEPLIYGKKFCKYGKEDFRYEKGRSVSGICWFFCPSLGVRGAI
jgi:hypothetical protein